MRISTDRYLCDEAPSKGTFLLYRPFFISQRNPFMGGEQGTASHEKVWEVM